MSRSTITLPCLLVRDGAAPRATSLVVSIEAGRLSNACHGALINLRRVPPITGYGRLDGPAVLAEEAGTNMRALVPAQRLAELGARV